MSSAYRPMLNSLELWLAMNHSSRQKSKQASSQYVIACLESDLNSHCPQKHFDELFPPLQEPSPEVLAQAALFAVVRDQAKALPTTTTPWSSLTSRRFGGDQYKRSIKIQTEKLDEDITVDIVQKSASLYDVTVNTGKEPIVFSSVPAYLINGNTLAVTLNNQYSRTTIVSQPPPPAVPASQSANTMERLHIFNDGQKTTLVLPSPKWLLSLGGDLLATSGALKAPMPSLIVELQVKVGDKVEKGQAVVIIESMKTETVLRANVTGVVKAVGCKAGEMVEEGRELVDIEAAE